MSLCGCVVFSTVVLYLGLLIVLYCGHMFIVPNCESALYGLWACLSCFGIAVVIYTVIAIIKQIEIVLMSYIYRSRFFLDWQYIEQRKVWHAVRNIISEVRLIVSIKQFRS